MNDRAVDTGIDRLRMNAAPLVAVHPIIRRKKVSVCQGRMDRAWAEISINNLCHNAGVLRRLLPEKCDIMAVVKANAYGHGDIEVSRALSQINIHAFAVATIDEGIRLRRNGIQGEILILGYTDPQRAAELSRYRISQTVVDARYAAAISSPGKQVHVHIKVDTGMHRLGESSGNVQHIAEICRNQRLKVDGIFTHLCVSDSMKVSDVYFTKLQISRFYLLLGKLKLQKIRIPKTHILSSYGVLNYPETPCDLARPGLALYGATLRSNNTNVDLRPVLSLKAQVVLIRMVAAGESVGYGRQFTAERTARLAVLPIGYADGIPRELGDGRGAVLIHGCRAPMIGSICMDQLIIDVTDIPDVVCGDIATLIGCEGSAEITVEEVASAANTITNDILSRLSNRLERVLILS